MNRRDIKNKNKIGDTGDVGTDNELQPLQGFSEGGFNSNGLNTKFGELSRKWCEKMLIKLSRSTLNDTHCKNSVVPNINMQ